MSKCDVSKKESRDKEGKDIEKPIVAKTAYDLQRLKLMKLMKNPEKPVLLPERPKSKNSPSVPEFVRNVMGSSAGAGSGEFHVYRHLRRKEYSRQKFIQDKGRKESLDEEYHRKLEQNKLQAEQVTAKKRAKRLKKKQKYVKKQKTATTREDSQEEIQYYISSSISDSSEDQNAENLQQTGMINSEENLDCKEIKGTIETAESEEKMETSGRSENVHSAGCTKNPHIVVETGQDNDIVKGNESHILESSER